jgi:hypothetical protein
MLFTTHETRDPNLGCAFCFEGLTFA